MARQKHGILEVRKLKVTEVNLFADVMISNRGLSQPMVRSWYSGGF